MKLCAQIIGLPLYSLAEGKSIGTIKSLVCNPAKGTVDALLLDAEAYYLAMRGVSLDSVLGMGEFVATIEHTGVVKLISSQPSIMALLENDVKILGSGVLTKMGEIIGTVTDLAIDEKTGIIMGCELTPSKSEVNRGFIARSDIITFSQQYLVVEEHCIERLANTPDELAYVAQPEPPVDEQPVNTDTSTDIKTETETDTSTDTVVFNDQTQEEVAPEEVVPEIVAPEEVALEEATPEIVAPEESAPVIVAPEEVVPEEVAPEKVAPEKTTHDVTSLFHERQRQFLLGRKVDRRLVAASGEVVAEQGEEITEALIDRAIALDKYLELTMNTTQ